MVQFMEAGQCYLVENAFRKAVLKVTFVKHGRNCHSITFEDVISGAVHHFDDLRSTDSPYIEFDIYNEENSASINEHNRIL